MQCWQKLNFSYRPRPDPLCCLPCGRDFNSLKQLKNHWDDESLHTWCRKCNAHFHTKAELSDHLRDPELHPICEWCVQTTDFETSERLRKHWLDDHQHTYCSLCVIHFDCPPALQSHALELHRYCEACDLHFMAPVDLLSHFKTSEKHAFTFCFDCEYNFVDSSDLREVCLPSYVLDISFLYLIIDSTWLFTNSSKRSVYRIESPCNSVNTSNLLIYCVSHVDWTPLN